MNCSQLRRETIADQPKSNAQEAEARGGSKARPLPPCHIPQRFSRREVLERLSAGALLTLGMWPGALEAVERGKDRPFQFIVVNDLHYMSPKCGAWLEGVVRAMKQCEPEFCLVAGDLTEYGRRSHLAAVRDILRSVKVPFYVQIGNHDYLGQGEIEAPRPRSMPLHAPSDARRHERRPADPASGEADRSSYETLFPGRLNYWFQHNGWQFVGLDTTEGLRYERTRIQPHTLDWLDANLGKLDRKKPTIIFTHFPMGAGVKYRPANADDLLDRFRPFNLKAVYCGHFHSFTERQWGSVTLTTNRCCALKRGNHDGTKEKGFFLCSVRDGVIERRFVECKLQG